MVSTEEMLDAVLKELSSENGNYNILISAAAPADYKLASTSIGKISTREKPSLDLHLAASKKIISFKAEHGLDDKELILRASNAMSLQGVIW